MRKILLNCCLILLGGWGFAQGSQNQFDRVPEAFRAHPELGKTTHNVAMHEADYELVQARTKYSRTFLNKNTTKTTVQSNVPMHYEGADGFWHTIDYRLTSSGGKIVYPAQEPFFELEESDAVVLLDGNRIKLKGQTNFVFTDANQSVIRQAASQRKSPSLSGDNELVFKDIFPHVDKTMSLYHQALKYSYVIHDRDGISGAFQQLIIEETLELPKGFSIKADGSRLMVIDKKGDAATIFQTPIISDSEVLPRGQKPGIIEGRYEFEKISERLYKIRMIVDGSWLKSADRVYPIIIDPVVTVGNNNIINSCYLPSYQQSILQVNVPAGESVLSSDLSYDFVAVAGTNAWMSDQRSYVSSQNGQTPLQNGTGNTAGTQTYNITNSPIGNGTSTGVVLYTFHFARNFGGSGCNADYNFVNRHEVMVTYGTIEFGDGPVVINEYSASNRYYNDGFGRYEDWIELYNTSPDTYFDLTGYYLSNKVNNPTKWQFTSGVIPPNGKVLVFCSNRDISSGTVFHTDFDISQLKPDQIVFSDPNGNILESIDLFVTQTNHSYGRTTDGSSEWSVFASPTPGTANVNGSSNYTSRPTFNLPPGKYPGPISITLSSTGPNEQIRYTLNGSTPTMASPLYSGPINISQTTVVRARAFSTSGNILPGFIETNTYFINENSTLPVLSFSGDTDLLQLLNGNGTIEPRGYLEYFLSDGTFIDENMGDFDKHGNDSWAYAQRGVDFVSRDDHGYKRRLEHEFFNTTDRTTFRRIIAKAAGSDNYPHQSGGAHFRDVFVQRMSEVANLELDERRATFVSLFVNGQYWGIYDIREKVDDNQYTDYYYGQDYIHRQSDQYLQYIKTWGSTYPEFGNQPALTAWNDLLAYVQNNDMSVEENYNYVASQLNIDSLVDYFVLNSYMVNKDWLNWNTSWWRGTDPSGGALKWRYALWDMDGVLGHYINYTGIPDISANADPCQVEEIPVGQGHTQTIKKLVDESPIVRQKYIARYADLLNTHFSCEKVTQVFDSIVNLIAPEMPRQIQRWGGNMNQWQANVQAAREFLLQRCSQTIATGLVECYDVTGPYATTFQVVPEAAGKIRMNSEWLMNFPFTAQIFGNLETLLFAEGNTGYEFSHWEVDGAVIAPDPENPDIMLQISQATTVTAHFNEAINNGEDVIYYWHFNNLNTPEDVTVILPDINVTPSPIPRMTYTGSGPRDIDANNNGSVLNLYFDQPSGKSARVRNPSEGRSVIFDLPTAGYKDIKFAYAVQRTNQGQLTNHISYSIDGLTFIQNDLPQTVFNVTTDFSLIEIDFTQIEPVNDNTKFRIKIDFAGNTTDDNGNNRFDNVTLKGTELSLNTPVHQLTTHQIFPNPATNNLHIITSEPMSEIMLFDMVGKQILKRKISNTTSEVLDVSGLFNGVYLVKIATKNGMITHKMIKR